jgi:hypothetical protein
LDFPRQETFRFGPTIEDKADAAVSFFIYVKDVSEYFTLKRMELQFQLLMLFFSDNRY